MGFLQRLFGRKLTPQQQAADFAALVGDALRDAEVASSIEYDVEAFSLRCTYGGDVRSVMYLENYYRDWSRAPADERSAILERIVRVGRTHDVQLPEFADARSQLRPLIRHRAQLTLMRLQKTAEGDDNAARQFAEFIQLPFGDHLTVNLAFDMPESLMQLSTTDLQNWNVDSDSAMAAALTALAEPSDEWFQRVAPGVYVSPWRDTYDASRLLLTEEIRRLPLRGDPVAIVPTRICTLITGSDDIDGLAKILELAIEARDEDRPVSLVPVRLYADGWRTFAVDRLHADEARLAGYREARQLEMLGIYETQTELLEKAVPEDVLVAPLDAFTKDDRVVDTFAQWIQGVPTLLPECDNVAFVRRDTGELALVPWGRVQDAMGKTMVRTEHWPPRFRVEAFPGDAEMRAMRAEWEKGIGPQ
jgi:hypothetical protein